MKQILLITAGALSALAASAQTTIFSDDFSGPDGDINGTSPTTAPGSETWNAAGYVEQIGGKLYGRNGGTGDAQSTNYLSYTLSAGNIYELSVNINGLAPLSDTSQYAGLGFFSTVTNLDSPYTSNDPTGPWMLVRTQNDDANEGDMSLRPLGSGSIDASTIDSSFDVTVSRNYKLVLNTSDTDAGTAGDQFSVALFVDGVQYGSTYTYDTIASASLLTNVVGVGLTASIKSGGPNIVFDNFLLTSTAVIPEPSTFALLAGIATMGFAAARRRRK